MVVLKNNRVIRSRAQLAREIVKESRVFLAFDKKAGEFFYVWPERINSVCDALWRVRERRKYRLHVGKQIGQEKEEVIGQLMLLTWPTEVEYVIIGNKKFIIHSGKDLAKIFAEW